LISRDHGSVRSARKSLLRLLGIVFVLLFLSACSTTTSIPSSIVSEWRNPAYAPGPFKRIIVAGPSGNTSLRRNFEDELVVQLRTAGVDALASYGYIPEDQGIDENQLRQVAQEARADAMLFPRSVQTEQKTKLGPTLPFSIGIFGPNVGAAWSGPAGSASVSRYKEYTSETMLYDVAKNELVWSVTIKTTEPENVQTAIKSYVDAVMKALDAQNLLPSRQ
jgi:hypothetical protein